MENKRFEVDEISEADLHETYRRTRRVDEGVAAIMSAYNSVNGDWAGEPYLLTEVLRDQWGWTALRSATSSGAGRGRLVEEAEGALAQRAQHLRARPGRGELGFGRARSCG